MSESLWWERPDRRQDQWNLADGSDLERALTAAERLMQSADERRRHAQSRSFAILSVLATLLLAMTASLIALARSTVFGADFLNFVGVLATVTTTGLVTVPLLRSWLKERRDIDGDISLRLATELAANVSEIFGDVADRERWSHLRARSTELRLSAFPLLSDTVKHSRRPPGEGFDDIRARRREERP